MAFVSDYASGESQDEALAQELEYHTRLTAELRARAAAQSSYETVSSQIERVKKSKASLFAYAPALLLAALKDTLDLVAIGSIPVIGTIITICVSFLIFLSLLITRANKDLIDSRFVLRMGIAVIAGFIVEGFFFGINFLPIEVFTVLAVLWMDRHLSDEQIQSFSEKAKSMKR